MIKLLAMLVTVIIIVIDINRMWGGQQPMKNKVAERAKKKRRALKEAERRKEQENLLKKFNEIAKKHGVNNVKYNK